MLSFLLHSLVYFYPFSLFYLFYLFYSNNYYFHHQIHPNHCYIAVVFLSFLFCSFFLSFSHIVVALVLEHPNLAQDCFLDIFVIFSIFSAVFYLIFEPVSFDHHRMRPYYLQLVFVYFSLYFSFYFSYLMVVAMIVHHRINLNRFVPFSYFYSFLYFSFFCFCLKYLWKK